ncbi:uncharacterized protein [Dermacentor albipictus]|uniref:uncharacterized protein n=1 Tax=Dermacentor albipictus TaxID=60249 RepID=UPI0038FCCF35
MDDQKTTFEVLDLSGGEGDYGAVATKTTTGNDKHPLNVLPMTTARPPTRASPSTAEPISAATRATPVPVALQAPPDTLVCTVSNMLRPEASALPPDGLCDVLFYESFYKDDMNILGDGYANLEPSSRHFVDQAYHAQKTLYGASFAFTRTYSTPDFFMTQEFYEAIDDFWVRKIHHFGFLNLYREFSAPEVVKGALLALRGLHFHHKHFKRERTFSYQILGLSMASINIPTAIDDTALFISTVFVPSMFIAIGHLSFSDASFHDCTILPPNNVFLLPPNVTYVHDLRESMERLRSIGKLIRGLSLSLSVGLSGRYYNPSPRSSAVASTADYGLFANCSDFSGPFYDDPANACTSANGGDWEAISNDSFLFTAVYSKRLQRTLTYDMAELIQYKVCGSKTNFTDVHFSLAAYDVNFDSSPEACEEIGLSAGAFRRLSTIRPLSNYLLSRYESPDMCVVMNFSTSRAV